MIKNELKDTLYPHLPHTQHIVARRRQMVDACADNAQRARRDEVQRTAPQHSGHIAEDAVGGAEGARGRRPCVEKGVCRGAAAR